MQRRPWVAEKGSAGKGRRGPLRQLLRTWRSLNHDARKLVSFIGLNLVLLVLQMGYGLSANYMGAPLTLPLTVSSKHCQLLTHSLSLHATQPLVEPPQLLQPPCSGLG
jgi:heme A synthase